MLGYADSNLLPEPKKYPRRKNCWEVSGRLRVELADKEGNPVVSHILTKENLLREMAKVIPTMESRRLRNLEIEKQQKQFAADMERRMAVERQGQAAEGSGGKGGGGKKK